MAMDAAERHAPLSRFEQIKLAQQIVRAEADAIAAIADRIDLAFCEAVERITTCAGMTIVVGMGKAGHIGQKISATLASTGTRSLFLHPAEALHGDLGRVSDGDIAIVLSQSGETEEIVRLLPIFERQEIPLIAITRSRTSTLGSAATVVIELGELREACTLGLAPSTSTAAMLAVGDALALVASHMRGFQSSDFARFHPGGALGRKLRTVDDLMRPLGACRVATVNQTVREVFAAGEGLGRRSGAVMVIGADRRLAGLFTDSDLARLFEARRYEAFDRPIAEVMTVRPRTLLSGAAVSEAVDLLSEWKLSELPVVDHAGRPIGMVDITDALSVSTLATPVQIPQARAG